MTTSIDPPARQNPRRWWILAVLCLSVLLVVVDNTIVNVALPTISRKLSASTQDLQWVVDAYTLVFAGLLLVGGNLGDRLGRRRMLQAGLVLFALTSVAAALSRSTGELIAGRAAMGIAAALIYPATLALLTTTFTSPRERATAIGIWSGVSGLAVAIGPVAGGLLLEHFSWSSVFYINVPIVIITLIAGLRLLPESRDPKAGRFDPLGALLSVAGVGLLVWTIIEAPRHGWGSGQTIGGLAGALVLLAALTAWQLRRPDPMLDVRLFRNPRFSAASSAIALAFFGLFGFIFMITQYFQVVRGYDPLAAGVATLPFAIVTGAVSPLAIMAMKRVGTKFVVTAGLVLMCAGFVVAARTAADAGYWGMIIAGMTLMAAGLALTASPATEAIMGALPPAKAGAGSAVNDTTREIGGTLGVAIVGSVMSSVYGSHIVTALTHLGAPPAATSAARDSVVAGLGVAAHLPPGLREAAVGATRQAFMDGLHSGSLVAAAATAAAALATLAFLPARAGARQAVPAGDAAPASAIPASTARDGRDAVGSRR
ncbi:MAG TPA: DHA2 family efflux MFS transporter permease subunit [Streptosporangiaceae bacterium]|nr:DHA2 family efflux MFS transporter permease subunit [Streptosporangiaceae bacterium]